MANRLQWLNDLSASNACTELLKCCGSQRWAVEATNRRPYESVTQLLETARSIWWSLDHNDWLEAFRSHPKIGERKTTTAEATQSQKWSEQEQAGVANSSKGTISDLARLNEEYEAKFGYIFIVCASGKSSAEMLALLRKRMINEPREEIRIAAAEQAKITELRLEKLLMA